MLWGCVSILHYLCYCFAECYCCCLLKMMMMIKPIDTSVLHEDCDVSAGRTWCSRFNNFLHLKPYKIYIYIILYIFIYTHKRSNYTLFILFFQQTMRCTVYVYDYVICKKYVALFTFYLASNEGFSNIFFT